ncbi:hypothetical protein FBUS_00631, partial [Fasciolopsis buskii]
QLPPIWVGHPTQFGPHLLLTSEDFEILWRLLKCRRCSFRRLYHKLAVREHKVSGKKPPYGFHSLTRAIKVVLNGLYLNRRCPARVILTSKQTSVIPPVDTSAADCLTVLQTSVSLHQNFVVCPSHGRELFDYLYCEDSASDNYEATEDELSTGSKNRFCIPRAHSMFFRSLDHDESSDDDENVNDLPVLTASTKKSQTVHIVSLSGQCLFEAVQTPIGDRGSSVNSWGGDLGHDQLLTNYQRITEANVKWSTFYETKRCDTPSSRISPKNNRHVRFPDINPVSSVRYMRTYFVALSLERRNRIWEIEARDRVYSRFLRLIAGGCDPCEASELAEQISDEEKEEEKSSTNSLNLQSVESVVTQPSSTEKRKKRKKRRKKTTRKNSVPPNRTDSWNLKPNSCPSLTTFYSNPVPCRLGGPA